MSVSNEILKKILKSNDLKVTKPRLALLSTLRQLAQPVTISEILSTDSINAVMNQTTAYRSLEQMVAKKILYKTHFQGEAAHYEWQDTHHHHITCSTCGYREAIDSCPNDFGDKILIKKTNFSSIGNHVLEFFGTCQKCSAV